MATYKVVVRRTKIFEYEVEDKIDNLRAAEQLLQEFRVPWVGFSPNVKLTHKDSEVEIKVKEKEQRNEE